MDYYSLPTMEGWKAELAKLPYPWHSATPVETHSVYKQPPHKNVQISTFNSSFHSH